MELTKCQLLTIAFCPGKAESFAENKLLNDKIISTAKSIIWARNGVYIVAALAIIATISTSGTTKIGLLIGLGSSIGLHIPLLCYLVKLCAKMKSEYNEFEKRFGKAEQVAPGIIIPGTMKLDKYTNFRDVIIKSLKKINDNPIGKQLFQELTKYRAKIFIVPGESDMHTEDGSSSLIFINTLSAQPYSHYAPNGNIVEMPIHVTIFHELVHAYHYQSDQEANSTLIDPLIWGDDEEYQTIMGFPYFDKAIQTPKITENAFRRAENLPERIGHSAIFCPSEQTQQTVGANRIRFIANKYKKWTEDNPLNNAPPPILQVTPNEFGDDADYIVGVYLKHPPHKTLQLTKFDQMPISSNAKSILSSSSFVKLNERDISPLFGKVSQDTQDKINIFIHKIRKEELPAR